MAEVFRKGKKRIISNSGAVQLDLNSDRVLSYDKETQKYRFITGVKPDGQTRTQISNEDTNVLDLP